MNRLSTSNIKAKLWTYADKRGAPVDHNSTGQAHGFQPTVEARVPEDLDPDPFGVLALEKQGLQIVEAGTHVPKSSSSEEFRSPTRSSFRRSFQSGFSGTNSWRTSQLSTSTTREKSYVTSDVSTQTESFEDAPTSPLAPVDHNQMQLSQVPMPTPQGLDSIDEPRKDEDEPVEQEARPQDAAEVVIHEITPASLHASKARLIAVPKRLPPALPPRNPERTQAPANVSTSVSHGSSPPRSNDDPSQLPSKRASRSTSFDDRNAQSGEHAADRSATSMGTLCTTQRSMKVMAVEAVSIADNSSASGESISSGDDSPVIVATAVMASAVARSPSPTIAAGHEEMHTRTSEIERERTPDGAAPSLEKGEFDGSIRTNQNETVSGVCHTMHANPETGTTDVHTSGKHSSISMAGIRGGLQVDDDEYDDDEVEVRP